jgi:hypothetical protein
MATCFGRRSAIIRPIQNIYRYNRLNTQWDPISFTVKVKNVSLFGIILKIIISEIIPRY